MPPVCWFVSERSGTRCQLKAGHTDAHRAWDENGIPTLVVVAVSK